MKDGAAPGTALYREAFGLGITYMCLTALIFGLSVFFSGSGLGEVASEGPSGQPTLIDLASGSVSFFVMSIAVWKLRRKKMIYNLVMCFVIAAFVSLSDFYLTMKSYSIMYHYSDLSYSTRERINNLFVCWAIFFGWSCVFLTLLYSFDVRDRERRLAAVREEAICAQMRALRYQINPHFLFNTLNSIAGLIEEGAPGRAGGMVLSLSSFLRTTLTLDPLQDVRLSEELSLQEEYLAIEHERYSDRMSFHIDMPEAVRDALVPSLILQPLIENAIKHGVGAMAGKVSISLWARHEGNRLRVIIENDMPVAAQKPQSDGMGVGLKNVAERLHARFNDDAHFSAVSAAPGLYRVALDMPWRTH